MATEHPCGSLPVSGWSVSVWYCHVHQNFWASQSRFIQRDGDAVELLSVDDPQWGPFDSSTDAQNWLIGHVQDLDTFHHLPECDHVCCATR